MGAQLIKEVASKTNDVAGDGTTTATVLAQAMVHEGMRNLAAGANPIILRKGMKKATDVAVEAIKNMSQTISGKKQIANVASISASDETVGQLVADAMEKVSKDGVITVEESKTMHTELDLVEGMQFDRGYVSAYMSTDMEKMEANLEDPYILITDKKISNIQEVKTRGAFVMAVTTVGNTEVEKVADYVVYLPETNPIFANSLAIIPLQLFGYYVSIGRGLDVDKPRNLAKSVTVE
mgnify:CR=1 FL=1